MLTRKARYLPLKWMSDGDDAVGKKAGTGPKRFGPSGAARQRTIADALRAAGLEGARDIGPLARAVRAANVKLLKEGGGPAGVSNKRRRTIKALAVPVMDAAVKPLHVAESDIDKAIRFTQQVFSR